MILYTLSIIGPLQLLFGAGTFLFLTGQHTKISTRWHHDAPLSYAFLFSFHTARLVRLFVGRQSNDL